MSINLTTANKIETLIHVVKKRKRSKTKKAFPREFTKAATVCWKESGMSRCAFAKTIGVSDSLIYNWEIRHRDEKKAPVPIPAPVKDLTTEILLDSTDGYIGRVRAGTGDSADDTKRAIACLQLLLGQIK